MKKRILLYAFGLLLMGCGSESKSETTSNDTVNESKPDNFTNEISEVIATFSSLNASDGEWGNGAEEDTEKDANLVPIENDRLSYCYDTQNLLKIEVYGSIYKASIEYVEGGKKTVIVNDKDIEGSFIIFSEKLGQHGKLIIKSQGEILKEITIEAEGCL